MKCYRCNDWPCSCADGQTIIHGDCREVLPQIGPVDLVVTDPPYGVGYAGGQFHSSDVNIVRKRRALAGDDVDVYGWAVPGMFDVCKGPAYIFFGGGNPLPLFQSIDAAGGQIHALLFWLKTNAKYAAMNAQYKSRHEPFLYCKGKHAKTNFVGATSESTVWEFKRQPKNDLHPTQKPTWLMQRAIANHDADLVLDPFAGSGTTLEAAKLCGRRAIGIEIEERYCEIAANRLRQEVFDFADTEGVA